MQVYKSIKGKLISKLSPFLVLVLKHQSFHNRYLHPHRLQNQGPMEKPRKFHFQFAYNESFTKLFLTDD